MARSTVRPQSARFEKVRFSNTTWSIYQDRGFQIPLLVGTAIKSICRPTKFPIVLQRNTSHRNMMNISEKSTDMNAWHLVGLVSSFPDISQDDNGCKVLPGCKTLSIPKSENADQAKRNRLSDLNDQVLVFKYKGFMHAIDNVR